MRSHHWNKTATFSYESLSPLQSQKNKNLRKDIRFRISALFSLWVFFSSSLSMLCGEFPSLTKWSWHPLVFVALLYISVFKSLYFCRLKMNQGFESSLCLLFCFPCFFPFPFFFLCSVFPLLDMLDFAVCPDAFPHNKKIYEKDKKKNIWLIFHYS